MLNYKWIVKKYQVENQGSPELLNRKWKILEMEDFKTIRNILKIKRFWIIADVNIGT